MATLVDIAERAEVAISTVSKYFNGGSVREANRKKIEKALTEIEYQPNLVARSLKTKKSNVFGILLPNLQSSFDVNLVTSMTNEIYKRNCAAILVLYENNTEKEKTMLRFLRDKQVDGVILLPSGVIHQEFQDFQKPGKKLVLVDRPLVGVNASSVLTDNYTVTYDAIVTMIKRGHRNIAIMTNDAVFTGKERLSAYRNALEDNGIPLNESYIKCSFWSIADGRALMSAILDECPEVTALIVCSEEFAIGAYQVLRERNVSIPDRMSVVSFDLYGISMITNPEISSIQQPLSEMGRKAVDLLFEEDGIAKEYIFPSSLTSMTSIKDMKS